MTRPEYNGSWPEVRKQVIARDGGLCQIRGPHCQVQGNEVDHIIAVSEGGHWRDPHNLRTVCRPCHNGRRGRSIVVLPDPDAQPPPSRPW